MTTFQQSSTRWRGCGVRFLGAAICLLMLSARSVSARTITITAEDCDQMAAINGLAPRLSWATTQPSQGIFSTQPHLMWNSKIALLMRFPITDIIPKNQRVTKAELTLSPTYLAGGTPQIHVRRVLAEWGAGVCHDYRMTYPKKIEWANPGGRGAGADRTIKDSAVFKFAKVGEQTVDVTEDIELWYTGGSTNHGWILTMEKDGEHIYLPSPYAPYVNGGKSWKLQITFEPK